MASPDVCSEQNESRATVLVVGRRTARLLCDFSFASASSPLFPYLHPFDTARRSDGTGRLRAHRKIGYLGEQNGQSVLPVAVGIPFAEPHLTGTVVAKHACHGYLYLRRDNSY